MPGTTPTPNYSRFEGRFEALIPLVADSYVTWGAASPIKLLTPDRTEDSRWDAIGEYLKGVTKHYGTPLTTVCYQCSGLLSDMLECPVRPSVPVRIGLVELATASIESAPRNLQLDAEHFRDRMIKELRGALTSALLDSRADPELMKDVLRVTHYFETEGAPRIFPERRRYHVATEAHPDKADLDELRPPKVL